MYDEDQSQLSKSQRRKLRQEEREQEKLNERKTRDKEKLIKKVRNYTVTIIIIILIAGFFYWRSIPPKDSPIIEVEPTNLNLGTVSQAKGTVSSTVRIMNKGTEPLILNKIETSCMCTSASIINVEGGEEPRFGMVGHGTNPTDWNYLIPPGESSKLKIYYDPNAHKELRGAITRTITIFSNDVRNPRKTITMNALQTD